MRAAAFFLAFFALSGSCLAAEPVEAGLSWQLAFGGQAPLEAGYRLSLGYRNTGAYAPLSRLMEFKADRQFAGATLAGLPLFAQSWQANQSEADAAYDAGVNTKPWYSKPWVLWTAGGIAASAALAGVSTSSNESHCTGSCNHGESNGPTTVYSGNPNGAYVGCVQGTCAVCPDGSTASKCFTDRSPAMAGFELRLEREDEDRNGGMGDLAAR